MSAWLSLESTWNNSIENQVVANVDVLGLGVVLASFWAMNPAPMLSMYVSTGVFTGIISLI
eukprot:3870520-Pyramimonas_sp.AAC.1